MKTINVDGYWSRDNVWIVMAQTAHGVSWVSVHDTKAEACENAQAYVTDATEKPDAVWVVKSPHFIAAE